MLTIEPATPSRRMILAAPWIMKNGARTLTFCIVSHSSMSVFQMLPRPVDAAMLTSPCTTPNALSTALITTAGGEVVPSLDAVEALSIPDDLAADGVAMGVGNLLAILAGPFLRKVDSQWEERASLEGSAGEDGAARRCIGDENGAAFGEERLLRK